MKTARGHRPQEVAEGTIFVQSVPQPQVSPNRPLKKSERILPRSDQKPCDGRKP